MATTTNKQKKVTFSKEQQAHMQKATWLSLIPGLGQFYNKQIFKGVIFLIIFALFVFQMLFSGVHALNGLITLGSTPREDHSLFIMIQGAMQLLLILIYAIFHLVNMVDARKVAKQSILSPDTVSHTPTQLLKNVWNNGFAYLLTVPAYILMIFTIVFPVLVTIFIAFTNYDFYHIPPATLIDWTGFETFKSIFTLSTYRDTFGAVFGWTIIWTLSATTLQIVVGIFCAIMMHQPFVKFKRIFGVILLLPWAVPAFITILSFSNIFNDSAGAINTQVIPLLNHLPLVDIPMISWKTDPFWTKIAIISIQGWLGFPYIYVLTSGILQSIPDDWYEASVIDGANALQKFRYITLPQIFAVAAPVFVTQYTFNFNNFSMIYLFNGGGPGSVGSGAGATDILISWIYKLTTGTSPQYNIASAITLIISAIVIFVSLLVFKQTKAFEMED
ncbi:sugar ABC transporter permease [Pisciglobus halotolerans]|uniref:Maltose/maltodextrin transport system permease protein n=1 Tax=Pisciglobus halotolerans TaxID=745365 RepID=A0A1I3AV71_9LACT|nr:sugar ABC transporter permease [Pisciglobus halotolerans]SFH53629.1 maltooligosaccharide ABC transporter membrane protein [Pisciglobus halotolerans]